MSTDSGNELNNQTRQAWDTNATVWDERMGDDGNDFHRLLVRPATERLLEVKPGDHILDIGCGNGLLTRRLASLGAKVVGIDFSESMIANARSRTQSEQNVIRLLAEVREQGTGNREQKEELRLKASKTLYF
jgi:2-polyprenyl-3-methyl-5-hydroxy-6-metoxy-1,4-benzoquinol methylase